MSEFISKEAFLAEVKQIIREGYETDPKGHETLDSATIWTSCYLEAEQMHEDNTVKDWAEMLKNGVPATDTVEKAMDFFDTSYDGFDQDYDPQEEDNPAEFFLEKIRLFW